MGFIETLTEIFKGSSVESLTLIAHSSIVASKERERVGSLYVHVGQDKNNRSAKLIRSTPSYHLHLHLSVSLEEVVLSFSS